MDNEQVSLFDSEITESDIDDILRNLPQEIERIEKLKKDLWKAVSIIRDGISRYKKEKLKARSKKKAEDLKTMFADLDNYGSCNEIQEQFGWGYISENEYRRLIELWELREKYSNSKMEFEDRVTKILDAAVSYIDELYLDEIEAVEEAKYRADKERKEVIRQLGQERQEYNREQYLYGIQREINENKEE